ncbi:hypothetical protein B0H16DRAFT_1478884, partial [Mycena metata]
MDVDLDQALADEAYYTCGTAALVHSPMQPREDTLLLERTPSPTDPYFTSGTTDVALALLRDDEEFFVARNEQPMEEPMDVDSDTDPADYPIGDERENTDDEQVEEDHEQEDDIGDEQEDATMENQASVVLDAYAAGGNGGSLLDSSGEEDDVGDEQEDVMIEDQTPVVLDVYAAERNGGLDSDTRRTTVAKSTLSATLPAMALAPSVSTPCAVAFAPYVS